jgi:hypothetical protein
MSVPEDPDLLAGELNALMPARRAEAALRAGHLNDFESAMAAAGP